MFSQRSHTIILVTFDCVARIDLRSGRFVEVVRSTRVNRSEHGEMDRAVRTGIGLGPTRCGRVYVLSDEFWSGHVSLADEIVHAVTEDQLEQALSLEAEYESGISPFESRLGYALLSSADGETKWSVTQAESGQLEAIAAAIPHGGGQLAAISAIAAFPPTREDAAQEALDTASSESCGTFAQAWLSQYLADKQKLPAIGVASPSWTQKQQRKIGMLSAVTVFFICVAFHFSGSGHLARARAELSELVDQETRLRAGLDENQALARRIREVKQQREVTEKARAEHLDELRCRQAERLTMRKRPVQLLHALAATADPAHWIQGIDLNPERVVISGVAVDSTSVATLAQRMESELDSSKWLIRTAEMSVAESIRLVRFEMTLVPLKEANLPLNVASSGAGDAR